MPRDRRTIGWKTIVTWPSRRSSRSSRVPFSKRWGRGPVVGDGRGPRLAGRRGGGVRDVGAAEAELEVGEVQHVALAERRVLDEGPVQEGAVPAAEVPQPQARPEGVDLGVGLRDGVGGQDQLEAVAAADAEGQGVDPHAPERAALGDGLQVPARLADRRARAGLPRLLAHARAPPPASVTPQVSPTAQGRARSGGPAPPARLRAAAGARPPRARSSRAPRAAGAAGAPRSRRRSPGARRGFPACGRTASGRGGRAAPRSRRPPPPP